MKRPLPNPLQLLALASLPFAASGLSCAKDDPGQTAAAAQTAAETAPSAPAAESEPEGSDEPVALRNLDADGQLLGGGGAGDESQLELKPLLDRDGRVSAHLPLPKSWQLRPTSGGKYTLTAPGGVRVGESDSAEYVYADDRFALQTLQQSGKQIAPVLPLDQIVDQALAPAARSQGYTLAAKYPLPGVQRFWEAFGAAMPATGSRRSYRAMGTDWKDAQGNRALIVILQSITRQGAMVSWSVHTTQLEAPAAAFEDAKKTYLDGLAHMQMDEEWQRAKGFQLTRQIRRSRQEAARWMQISAEGHKRRMADIEAMGRTTRAIGRSNSDVLDQSHAGFQNRAAMRSAGQASTVEAIRETITVAHPESGKRFEVDSGSAYYWSDGRGGYFGTNDPNYDPRTDPRLDDREWVQLQPQAAR